MVAKTSAQPQTSTVTSTPTSASVASTTELGSSSANAHSAPLSQPRCIRVPGLACQPVMEATKALAQRLSLRRRSSRWRDRRWSATKSAAGDTPAPASGAGDPPVKKATAPTPASPPAVTTKTTTTTIPTKADPVDVTTAESEKETVSSPLQTDEAIPSPGSGISPTTIVTQPQPQSPKQTEHSEGLVKSPDERVIDSVTEIEYFPHVVTPDTHNEDHNPAEDIQTSKITFAIPTKGSKEDESSQDAGRQSDEIATVTSSASPSTAVSPRESQDDYDEDAGRSSTLSGISGNGSRQSSINSVAFQLPNMSLPQGRTRRHKNSPPPLSR